MKYVVYDIIESQAGTRTLFIGAAVDVDGVRSLSTSLSSLKVLLAVGGYGRFGAR